MNLYKLVGVVLSFCCVASVSAQSVKYRLIEGGEDLIMHYEKEKNLSANKETISIRTTLDKAQWMSSIRDENEENTTHLPQEENEDLETASSQIPNETIKKLVFSKSDPKTKKSKKRSRIIIPIPPQTNAVPIGRDMIQELDKESMVDEILSDVKHLNYTYKKVNFYTFLRKKLLTDIPSNIHTESQYRQWATDTKWRIVSMHAVFQVAVENISQYEPIIQKASRDYGVPVSLIRAIITQESHANPQVRSHKGAKGLMQVIDTTGDLFGVDDLYDPVQNIRAGTQYIRDMIYLFQGNKDLAIAAYNAGGGAVQRYGEIPPYRETQNYVERVKDFMVLYQ